MPKKTKKTKPFICIPPQEAYTPGGVEWNGVKPARPRHWMRIWHSQALCGRQVKKQIIKGHKMLLVKVRGYVYAWHAPMTEKAQAARGRRQR